VFIPGIFLGGGFPQKLTIPPGAYSKGDGREERGDGKAGEANPPEVKVSRINTD